MDVYSLLFLIVSLNVIVALLLFYGLGGHKNAKKYVQTDEAEEEELMHVALYECDIDEEWEDGQYTC